MVRVPRGFSVENGRLSWRVVVVGLDVVGVASSAREHQRWVYVVFLACSFWVNFI